MEIVVFKKCIISLIYSIFAVVKCCHETTCLYRYCVPVFVFNWCLHPPFTQPECYNCQGGWGYVNKLKQIQAQTQYHGCFRGPAVSVRVQTVTNKVQLNTCRSNAYAPYSCYSQKSATNCNDLAVKCSAGKGFSRTARLQFVTAGNSCNITGRQNRGTLSVPRFTTNSGIQFARFNTKKHPL